jgi:hypothetical protein
MLDINMLTFSQPLGTRLRGGMLVAGELDELEADSREKGAVVTANW